MNKRTFLKKRMWSGCNVNVLKHLYTKRMEMDGHEKEHDQIRITVQCRSRSCGVVLDEEKRKQDHFGSLLTCSSVFKHKKVSGKRRKVYLSYSQQSSNEGERERRSLFPCRAARSDRINMCLNFGIDCIHKS
ncbi:unnamed protein product [Orchesella dallaii]|uniref:Uncharacterized protein n=1 Tax=Orchesella dallaii TaxID=48710 RepID=A0ABP1PM56_9HEXA